MSSIPHPSSDPHRIRLSRSIRWGYGGGEWANAVVWTAFTSLFVYFMTDTVHMSAAFAGTVVLVGTLWNTVLQPFVGMISDRTTSRMGRRRPFLIFSLAPYMIASWLLFTDIGATDTAGALYYAAVVVVWFTSLSAFYVPYSAMGAELTADYDERTSLSTVRTVFSQLGALLGATLPLALLEPLTSMTGSADAAWSIAGAILAAFAGAGILVTWITSRAPTMAVSVPVSTRLRDAALLLRSRTFRLLMGAYVFGWAPLSLIGTIAVFYAVHIMDYTESDASVVLLAWFAAGLAWLPLVGILSRRIGKVATYLVFTISWAIVQVLFLIPSQGDDVVFWVALLGSSAGSMAVAVTGWSLLADVTDVEQLRSGRRQEGAMYGMAALAQTGFAAVVVWAAGIILSASGYTGEGAPSENSLLAIRLLLSIGPGLCLIPGILFASRIRLTRGRHDRIRAALEGPGPLTDGERRTLLEGL
ncbi:MAG TPA: MFS transporter [Microbacterium sp.]|uniref:MFS transporter n=1 Tax=Microbacterium sp. TaxID=51671 RepID=UPI002B476504|nr:MFS transporter [Microbacterium sp.]HKT58162.1 MFS transporter [Microbacterium sp.]